MTISSNLFGHVTFYNFSKAKMMVCSSNGVKLPGQNAVEISLLPPIIMNDSDQLIFLARQVIL